MAVAQEGNEAYAPESVLIVRDGRRVGFLATMAHAAMRMRLVDWYTIFMAVSCESFYSIK